VELFGVGGERVGVCMEVEGIGSFREGRRDDVLLNSIALQCVGILAMHSWSLRC
jgi:hypothetical protein